MLSTMCKMLLLQQGFLKAVYGTKMLYSNINRIGNNKITDKGDCGTDVEGKCSISIFY